MKDIHIVGNWKMNKNSKEAKEFVEEFKTLYEQEKDKILKNIKFGIAAPFVILQQLIEAQDIPVFAQDVSYRDNGAFTGDISAKMLKDLGVTGVVIGHSERRQYHKETDLDVNKKVLKALELGLTPIVCVGETYEEYVSNLTKKVVDAQIKSSLKSINDFSKVIIAYEPIWAIGTGQTATPEIAQEVCSFIRSITAPNAIIQYGGSVNEKNVADLMGQKDIDGALVGGASLDAKSFVKLLTLGK